MRGRCSRWGRGLRMGWLRWRRLLIWGVTRVRRRDGAVGHPTVQVFVAGGVPEVMLHLRKLGLLHEDCLTAAGEPLGKMLDWWQTSERRHKLREVLIQRDGVNPDDVILSPTAARARGLT